MGNNVRGAEKVRQSIWIILDTEPGERIMRPTFGCGLRRYLMKPNTTSTRALIQREVTSALTSVATVNRNPASAERLSMVSCSEPPHSP